jgi:alanyl-tRNA synthetase
MQSHEIRQRFLNFFAKRGHAILPSASLVPENDPSVLFNTAGMQPLVPYLLGQKHPLGTRLASCQKCVRTGDLDDIGDNRHFSFFEMLGNWSLGDYFKEDAIKWSYEFLTNSVDLPEGDRGLGLDKNRLYITIFKWGENTDKYEETPYDVESEDLWIGQGIPKHRIYRLGMDDNWWSPGANGPSGPCTEIFYDMDGTVGDLSHEEFVQAVKDERVIEIWNDVFMEYEKRDGKVIGKLSQKNVDTGAGLERLTAVMQGKKTAYDTDIFEEAFIKMQPFIIYDDEKSKRIVADHLRTSVFMIADGIIPSNNDRGYVLRRLIRRAVRFADKLGFKYNYLVLVAEKFINKYEYVYPELRSNTAHILNEINKEEEKFRLTLKNGLKEFEKGIDPFILATTYGFPIELTEELAKEKGIKIDREDFDKKMAEHQKLSQTSSAGMFKGGLANHNEKTIRLHTAHHLLLAGLQEVLGKSVKQRGSNITEERLRMDFAFDRKVTTEELAKVEELVNGWINKGLPVVRREMPREEAEKFGAEMEFGAKYPDMVSVYTIQNSNDEYVSKEFCGGPHVGNTSELGKFKIQKEEASSAGVRRIKAVLE